MSDQREVVATSSAPEAIGPYSQAIAAGNLLFCSGQIPLDPFTGELVGSTASEQASQCIQNLEAVVTAAGSSLEKALRVTIYMTDLAEFDEVNKVYGSYFKTDPPARVTVGVASLPKGAQIEIEAIVGL